MDIQFMFNREDNPEYYALVDEYNALLEKWNLLMDSIQKFKIPQFFLFGTKQKLRNLVKEVKQFDASVIDWKGRAQSFTIAPPLQIGGIGSPFGYILLITFMRDLINNAATNMRQMIMSYNMHVDEFKNRKNIVMGVSFFAFGCILQIVSWIFPASKPILN